MKSYRIVCERIKENAVREEMNSVFHKPHMENRIVHCKTHDPALENRIHGRYSPDIEGEQEYCKEYAV
ncbi:Uncharacterised protein [uncultured archaeon]|nr:Uncharacterised protein [uncultured archaeon]